MPLEPDRSLLHYRLVEKLGEGGMGVVWKAVDTTLDREVAIKVLPDAVAAHPERLSRFEREAKLLASLNHPNIAAVYGLHPSTGSGKAATPTFIAMELVPGENLATRLGKGRLSTEEALEFACKIADALATAHDNGVIHRDLKPANIQVTLDGNVKVLDFGLAKAFEPDGMASGDPTMSPSLSPTMTASATVAGMLLGTAAYMSPEQARGRPVDRRADIWAFGAVLYEMLSGQPAFGGETITDVLASVVKEDPDWERLPADTPAAARRVLRRCLAKDARKRLRDAADAKLELEEVASDEPGGAAPNKHGPGSWVAIGGWLAAIVLGPLIGWTIWQFRGRPVTDAAVRRVSIALPESTPVALAPWTPLGVGRPSIALSPDASTLVYVTVGDDGVRRLAIRSLDDYEARVLPGTDEAFSPFFSPDGSWVAFFTLDRLRKVALRGGDPVTLCVARNPYGGTWHGDIIVFSDNEGAALVTVPDDGGKPKPVAATSETDATQEYWPRFLPDGRHVIAAVSTSVTFDTQVQAINIETGERTTLVEGGRYPVFLAPGHLLFVREHDLFAVGFDPRRLEVSGDPVPVVQGIRVEAAGAAQVTVSDDGTLAYLPGVRMDRGELVWVDRSGGVESLGFEHELFGTFDLSSDDSRVAVRISQAESQLWMYDLGRGTRVKLTLDGNHGFPTLSPGGDRIAFTSDRDGEPRVYIQELGGGSNPVAVTQGDGRPYSWHPDGGSLAIDYQAGGEWGVGLIDVDGTNLREVAATGDSEWGPAFSPDGNYLAYTDDRTGRYEVYVRELSSERTWQASSEGGEEPLFSSDGKLLLYRNGDSWMEMTVRHEPTFELGRPREVLRGPYLNITGRSYDVSNDGERFLLIRTAERDGLAHDVNVIFNLRAELGR